MFIDNVWYLMEVKDEYKSDNPVDGLDVAILQNNILSPVLGIEDPKTDKRIDFVGGIRGIAELEKRVRTDSKAAFAMYPTLYMSFLTLRMQICLCRLSQLGLSQSSEAGCSYIHCK
jgi:uncharacterized protein (DUF1015 family)